ncbi:MAG: hypothetical protein OXH31_06250 [Gammaproteobacteria bacterium]|nr:hypothetical protein [Gammaproteobacteria bacterium]
MNRRTIWVLAKAEMRSCRRLARTWVFIALALILCVLMYVSEIGVTAPFYYPEGPSGWTHTTIAPQYTVNEIVFGFGAIFVIGIVFLSFDIRARDVQNRMSEVIDSKPANNLEVTVGRLAGILLLLLFPMVFFLGGISIYEVLAHYLELSYRYGLLTIASAWGTIVEFMIFLLLFGSLVACLAVLLRNRLVVALISLGLMYGLVLLSAQPSFHLQEASIHSDIVSDPFSVASVVIQLALLVLSCAFIAFASAFLPRTQPQRQFINVGGGVCLLAGILSIAGLMSSNDKSDRLRQEWKAVHDPQEFKAFPDIQHLQGSVDIWPNNTIKFDLTLTVRPPASNPSDSVIFSLNPSYEILNVYIDDNELTDFNFGHGLLKISAAEWTKDEHRLRITAQGKPDEHFAYLDEARDLSRVPSAWIPRFGTKNYIFHSDFVALMPSIKWYPTSGTAMHEDLLENRPKDVFTTDLTVSVPKKWTVAMVGRRELVSQEDRFTYRFTTQAPVPELALISSIFEQRGKTIEGIEIELLFSKKHTQNLEVLAPYEQDFEDSAAEIIRNARALSFEYPYESFYVVEVPSTLRIYGGGWRMDSVLQPPGMMLVRETTFPTARFETVVGEQDRLSFEVSDQFALNMVVGYFADDLQGGSPFVGISRNFVNHQSSPAGRGSTVINYLLEQLSTQLIMKEESLFLPSLWEFGFETEPADFGVVLTSFGGAATQRRLDLLRTPSTWETIEQTPLFTLDFQSEPLPAFRALLAKAYVVAENMIEYYSAEKVSAFLQRLTSAYQGGYYSLNDFVEAAATSEIDLNEWVLDWLEGTTLPGFIIAEVRVAKLKENESSPYQTTFIVHNGEPVAGLVEVRWDPKHGGNKLDPIFLGGYQSVEIAIQSDEPLNSFLIEPNFALNRELFRVWLPKYDGESVAEDPTKPLLSEVDWLPQETTAIVVDDLDPGFSIVGPPQQKKHRINIPGIHVGPYIEELLDQGLPVRRISVVGGWERKSDPYSYSFGRYRRTLALIARGNQNTYAKFTAEIPHTGNWQLEYFVPGRATHVASYEFARNSGTFSPGTVLYQPRANPNRPNEHYTIQVTDGQSTWNEQFDIANATQGWNVVNKFELSSDKVDVLVSDFAGRSDIIVYADAIRWSPIDSE